MTAQEPRELVYLGEGSRAEMSKLQAVLAHGGVRSEIVPPRAATHACGTHVELAVASGDHPAAVDLILQHWANGCTGQERPCAVRSACDAAQSSAPRLLRAIPVLPAADLSATIAFYESRLGFSERFLFDDYAAVARDGFEIHFWLCGDRNIAQNTSCRLEVQGIDALYERCRTQGLVHPDGPLAMQPWGMREFAALDLDGNLLTFVEPDHVRESLALG